MVIRVLHVGPLPPPLGGISVLMQSLMEASQLKEYDNLYFNTSSKTTWALSGYKRFDSKRVMHRLKLASQLALCVRRTRPHIIHFHCGSGGPWDFLADILMFLGAKTTRAKMIFHWHRDPLSAIFPGRSFITRSIFRATAGRADSLIVLSERYRQSLPDRYKIRTCVVPNTFDSALLSIPCPRPIKRGIRVIFIGRLTREKGILDLFQLASETAANTPDLEFILAGIPSPAEGGMPRLQELVNKLSLNKNVKFVGPVTENKKLQFFSQGDIMLFPSYRESFGIAAIEGMASGIPILAYSVGLLPDFIHDGVNGFLAESGNIHALLVRLLELIADPDLRARMGRNGREEVIKKFGIDLVANKVRNIYAGLVDNA